MLKGKARACIFKWAIREDNDDYLRDKGLIDDVIAEELELYGIDNQLSYRRECTHDPDTGEDDDDCEVGAVGEGGFGGLVGDVIEKHW